jgi:hypothetical protein
VWEWTYVKAQTTLFPQSILLHASCLISKAIDITWLILNLHKLYYTKKKKLLISLSLLADCSNQNGFEKQTVKNKILKDISGSIPAQLRVGSSIFFSLDLFYIVRATRRYRCKSIRKEWRIDESSENCNKAKLLVVGITNKESVQSQSYNQKYPYNSRRAG